MKLATGEATLGDLRGKAFTMPDLTAFLCAFSAGFRGSSTLGYASLVDSDGHFILTRESSGIPVREIHEDILVSNSAIRNILSTVEVEWDATWITGFGNT
jgi:hypothetical protein